MSKKNNNSNFISVIVPVYNEEKNIRFLIESLLCLNYPKNKYEIIIVDNNSEDKTAEIIKEFQVIYLCEKKQSSYAARNKGVKTAKGDIIAFTDGDCILDKDWLKNAITHFINEDIDIIAGAMTLYNYSISLKLIDIYQLITLGERQVNSQEEGKCASGNLIVKKEIFEKIGYFKGRLVSGGDGEWTKRATDHGFKLRYCSDVEVYHPLLEDFRGLLKRAIRIGYGKGQIRYLLHKSSISSFSEDNRTKNILKWALRIYYNSIKMFCNNRKQKRLSVGKLLLLSLLSILLTSASFYGVAKGFISFKLNRKFK